jgi:DivIVA domain-containing protein
VSIVLLLVLLAVVAAVAVVATGRGGAMGEVTPDRSPRGRLPDGDVARADIDALRFTTGLRGYRMDEVDDVLDRLATELEQRDRRITELEAPDRDTAELEASDRDTATES